MARPQRVIHSRRLAACGGFTCRLIAASCQAARDSARQQRQSCDWRDSHMTAQTPVSLRRSQGQ
jgi:hypothetical protein